jgi:penicillin amidase
MMRLLPLAAAALMAGCAAIAPDSIETQTTTLPALQARGEILVDRWGVSHIYAANTYDAFVLQGYAAARDRLWQMDLWRKRGLGEMAQDFGPAWVEHDRMARAVLYRGDMYREWLAYGSDAKKVAESFVAGVNAFVAQVEADPRLLPEEFRLLGYKPSRWNAEDTVRIRHHGLTLNFTSEVDRAAALCAGAAGVKADWLRRELDPPVVPKVAEGLDPCGLPVAELKRIYTLATDSPRFTRSNTKLAAIEPGGQTADADTLASYGSNNWVIAASLTATGRPILANDPHRSHGAPSLRYVTHISAPGMDVIGAGEPFLPGISIGHNGTIAFGLTRFYMDQEDLYVYETNPAAADEYRYRGRWEPMTIVTETIRVKGEAAPRTVTNKFTRHGPVLVSDPAKQRAYALRAAWLEPGMAPYFGSMDYMRARNWEQFQAAMNRWGAPGENQVYADTSGNIGWIPGGLTPIRPNWDGLTPVPGDGRYEWSGYRNGDELPWELNPQRGYVVTANENNIPPQHPAYGKGVGYEWSDAARARRLKGIFAEAAGKQHKFTLEDSQRMQTDVVATPAQRYLALLKPLQGTDPTTTEALRLLQAWDGGMRPDSSAAALYEVWSSGALRTAVLRTTLADRASLAGAGDNERVLLLMEKPQGWMSDAQRDELLLTTLASAMQKLRGDLGADPAKWSWGALHHALFRHPLEGVVAADEAKRLSVGEWPIGGSAHTPMATSYRPSDYALTAGASFRMVLDVGNWDGSRFINTPGQSGDPSSPHYRDLAPIWVSGAYVPLLYSRAAVQAATQKRMVLVPAP